MKRLASIMLALLLAMSTFVFIACQDDDSGDGGSVSDVTTDKVEEVDPDLPKDLGKTYNNAPFRVLLYEYKAFKHQYSEDGSGDKVDSALYKRDLAVEDKLKVEIEYTKQPTSNSGMYVALQEMYRSGDAIYELVLCHPKNYTVNMVGEQLVLNWNSLESVDFSKPYWNQDMNKNLAIAGVLPFVVSNYLINDPDLLFVNMELASDYPALPNIYSLVDSNTWTWDTLKEMSRIVKKDLDGGTTWDITDQYGFAINLEDTTIPLRSLPYSIGERVYDRDEEGNIILTAYTDKKHDFVLKILDLFDYDGGIILDDDNYSVFDSKYFGMGTSLIYQSSAGTASVFREVEFEFGIVPMPKYDEAQERYMQIDWGGLMCIPRLHPNAEFVGDVVEWLSYYGYKDVYPEFYNTLLCEKVGRGQEDSKKALDTIFSNLVYDAAMNYTSQNYYVWFDHFIDKKDANVKSWIDSRTAGELVYIENLTNLFIALGAAE